ncbi:MAG: hypothetical protein U5O39_19505 [Gammaproteobacteria bacterium]|nr:hypothetical protein [Gammaproteobacteria bacterium]
MIDCVDFGSTVHCVRREEAGDRAGMLSLGGRRKASGGAQLVRACAAIGETGIAKVDVLRGVAAWGFEALCR